MTPAMRRGIRRMLASGMSVAQIVTTVNAEPERPLIVEDEVRDVREVRRKK